MRQLLRRTCIRKVSSGIGSGKFRACWISNLRRVSAMKWTPQNKITSASVSLPDNSTKPNDWSRQSQPHPVTLAVPIVVGETNSVPVALELSPCTSLQINPEFAASKAYAGAYHRLISRVFEGIGGGITQLLLWRNCRAFLESRLEVTDV